MSLFCATPTGLTVSGDPTAADWTAFGASLFRQTGSLSWVIGDWLLFGEGRWGELYARAQDLTGLDYDTLACARRVAGRFEFTRRRVNLSFGHHVEVSGLPPSRADELLSRAAAGGLSRNQLRALVRGERSAVPPRDPRAERLTAALRTALSLKKLVGDLVSDTVRIELEHVLDELNRLAKEPAVGVDDDRASPEDLTTGRIGRRV